MVTEMEYMIYSQGIEYVYKNLKEYNKCLESSKKLGCNYYKQAIIFITSEKDEIKFKIKQLIMDYIQNTDELIDDDTVDYDYIQKKLHEYHNIQEV